MPVGRTAAQSSLHAFCTDIALPNKNLYSDRGQTDCQYILPPNINFRILFTIEDKETHMNQFNPLEWWGLHSKNHCERNLKTVSLCHSLLIKPSWSTCQSLRFCQTKRSSHHFLYIPLQFRLLKNSPCDSIQKIFQENSFKKLSTC